MIYMPWNTNDYPASMKNLDGVVRKKAIDIGNALLDSNYPEDRAIPIAISQAKEWYKDASEKEVNSYKYQENPKKSDEHDDESNTDLLDNDVKVFLKKMNGKCKLKALKDQIRLSHTNKMQLIEPKKLRKIKIVK